MGNNQSGNRQWEITQIMETDSGDYPKSRNRQWGLPQVWKQTVGITPSVETDRLWEDTEGTENAIGPRDWGEDSKDSVFRHVAENAIGPRDWGEDSKDSVFRHVAENAIGPRDWGEDRKDSVFRHVAENAIGPRDWGEDSKDSVFRHVASEFSVVIIHDFGSQADRKYSERLYLLLWPCRPCLFRHHRPQNRTAQ